jgi:hypothetical protein
MSASFDTFDFKKTALICKKIEYSEFNTEDINLLEVEAKKSIAIIKEHQKLLNLQIIENS